MADENKSPELEAIEKVTSQVDEFKKQLGDRVGKEEFAKATKSLDDLKDNLGKWEEKKIDSKIDEINASITKFGDHIQEMQEEIQQSKEKGSGTSKSTMVVAKEDVEAFLKKLWREDDFKRKSDVHAEIKMGGHIGQVVKAAENFGYPQFFEGASGTVSDAFTGRFIDPTLYQRKRKRNLILDNMPVETISVPKLVYLEKIEVSGDDASSEDTGSADWIVSGGQKPARSFRVTTGEAEAKKVAIFGTVEDKLLRDVASLETWIREDFTDEMMEAYNDALLNNNPSVDPNAPLGLKQNAIQYAATDAFDASITDANEIDAMVAVIAYMATLHEEADRLFVSDDMYYRILVLKGTDGHYQNKNQIFINSLGQMYIAGKLIVPADVEDVPSTHVLAIGMNLGFKIKNYGPMVFERGLNGEDFRYDRTSYRGYQETMAYISQHRYNSVLYDTFDNILTAITAGS